MRLLFVYPNQIHQENVSLGLSYISSYVKQFGHETALIDYTWGGTVQDCINKCEEFKPHLVGFSLTSGDLMFSLEIARAIKRLDKSIKIMFGASHATVAPKDSLQYDEVDMACVGEAEESVRQLLDHMQNERDYYDTPNFWFKKENGEIVSNCVSLLEMNLDKLPFPDRDLWNMETYINTSGGNLDMIAGRGCPYKCTYCIIPKLHEINEESRKQVRFRSVDNIIAEVKYLQEKYKGRVKMVSFQDDVFALAKPFIAEFSEKFPKECGIPFICNGRVEAMDEKMAEMLAKAGCSGLNMGIETGSQTLRRSLMRRDMSNEHIIRTFKAAKKFKLKTNSYNIVGSPYETERDIWETIKVNRECEPDYLQVSIFQPYQGTDLHTLSRDQGWMTTDIMPVSHKLTSIMKYPYMTPREIVWQKKLFRFRVMRKTKPLEAFILLLLDTNYELFVKFRTKMPTWLKRFLYIVLRKFSGGDAAKTSDTYLPRLESAA
ncbi:MAG: B12-binding domain-containing radical SAM protein [Deltaproteobacteria bacterium]|nr:B12-binding domain-containing radical SAM protein [Deltaproteobacteria bacterium]